MLISLCDIKINVYEITCSKNEKYSSFKCFLLLKIVYMEYAPFVFIKIYEVKFIILNIGGYQGSY